MKKINWVSVILLTIITFFAVNFGGSGSLIEFTGNSVKRALVVAVAFFVVQLCYPWVAKALGPKLQKLMKQN